VYYIYFIKLIYLVHEKCHRNNAEILFFPPLKTSKITHVLKGKNENEIKLVCLVFIYLKKRKHDASHHDDE
jgi:hypothetical protein